MKTPTHSIFVCVLFLAFVHSTLAQAPAVANSVQTQIDGFLNIPFGANPETLKKQYPSRARGRFNRQLSHDGYLWFDGGKFAGFKVHHAALLSMGDRFWMADVRLESTSKDHEKEYATFKKLLSEKYGPPSREERTEGIECSWTFPVADAPPSTILLGSDPHGVGAKIMYISDSVKAGAPKAVVAPQKPAATASTAKDDL